MPGGVLRGSRTAAILGAAALVAVALVLRVAVAIPGTPGGLDAFVPVLLGAAGLCAAGLTIRRAPSVAWLCAAAAAGIAALEILGCVRRWQPFAPVGAWPWLVATADAALIAAALIAALEATRPRDGIRADRRRVLTSLALAGLAGLVALALWALLTALDDAARVVTAPELSPIRWTGRLGLGLVLVGVVTGAILDLVPPVSRARRRLGPTSAEPTTERLAAFVGFLVDELVPSLSIRGRRAADTERARLAADLHARVLPDLRRAAVAAALPGVPASVAADVRGALAEVEQLMEGRQSIVLESFGLIAALEWLAERLEDRSSVRVAVDLDGDRIADPGALPPNVSRALFRIALLAMDNVERHAGAANASLRLSVDRLEVRLAIADDGRGLDRHDRDPARHGRGLADMRAEAAAVGAGLTVSSDRGTTVQVTWRPVGVPGEHATSAADSTARRQAGGD